MSRITDAEIAATYGTRDAYLDVCAANLAVRRAETYDAYKARSAGLSIMPRPMWEAAKRRACRALRANILVNT